jgi:hypothetical protein
MDAQTWKRVQGLFAAAMELPEGERDAFLSRGEVDAEPRGGRRGDPGARPFAPPVGRRSGHRPGWVSRRSSRYGRRRLVGRGRPGRRGRRQADRPLPGARTYLEDQSYDLNGNLLIRGVPDDRRDEEDVISVPFRTAMARERATTITVGRQTGACRLSLTALPTWSPAR